jgi:RNA polymerase sigma-70 factor (ECF subfamily)
MATRPLEAVLRHIRRLADGQAAQELTDGQLVRSFCVRHDQAAFAALVERHGPLVFNVCRNILHHQQDAEDAFQVTLLVLARSAPSIRRTERVVGWLHGVAYRSAMQIKREAARRRLHERKARSMSASSPPSEPAWRELQALVNEEVRRLPENLRLPFIYCCLEGKTKSEAARELGWKEGTVSGRLAQARKRLQQRLTRRGVTLSAVLSILALAQSGSAANVSSVLVDATTRACLQFAAGQALPSGVVSTKVLALTKGVLKTMVLSKLQTAGAVFLMVCVTGLGAGVLAYPTLAAFSDDPKDARQLAIQPKPKEANEEKRPQAVVRVPRTDKERIQGTWALVSGEFNGHVTKDVGDMKMVFKREQIGFTTKFLPADVRLTYKLEPAQNPKSVDFLFKNPSHAETMKGIYELNGDALKLCVHIQAVKAQQRPREFKTEADSQLCLFVLKRQKVDADRKPKAAEVPPPKPADAPKTAAKPPTKADGIVFLLNEELAMIQPDGKGYTRLPTKAKHVFWFHVSPDGKRLAYTTTNARIGGRFHTYVTDLFSESSIIAGISRLAGNDLPEGEALDGEVECAIWSADGTKLACCDAKARNHSIVDVKTGEKSQLNLPEGHWLQDWSPDGNWFLTTKRYEDTEDKLARVYLVKKDGSEVRCLNGSIQHAWFPRFSPDGRKVLLVSWEKPNRVFVLDLREGKPRPVSPELNAVVLSACWSPDGKRIAYAWHQVPAKPDSDNPIEFVLSVIDADGKNPLTLRTEKGRLGPSVHVDWR